MVKFGLPVFLRFGLMVKNSAFRFSYDSVFQIRPNGPVRLLETFMAVLPKQPWVRVVYQLLTLLCFEQYWF